MRIARIGRPGQEIPALAEGPNFISLEGLIEDWSGDSLRNGAFEKISKLPLDNLPRIPNRNVRVNAPISKPTKVICIGLNYLGHIKETNAETPIEPITFMKSPDTVVGPYDEIRIPPNSMDTDYEVELAVVIGKTALYLRSPSESESHILGYTVSQDISERHWQLERNGQWMKGKSFPTFNPLGPTIVTGDELKASNLRLWCSVNGEMRQDDRTSNLLFGVDYLVWYLSQFMELMPGDIINTGTPFGVGLGMTPKMYLRPGDVIETGIENIGNLHNKCIATPTLNN
jgi:2-keto-4-pentenoate hydratase/2-oxohepta-3-ene-1,7-dioic acid hydratase in catechol pathway